jgi:hypothetical protein
MDDEGSELSKIQEIRTTDDVEQANQGLEKGWVLLKITENVFSWEDGGKTSKLTYHLGRPKKLPV